MPHTLPDIHELHRLVSIAASYELVPRFNEVETHLKMDGSVVTEADYAMQHRLHETLAKRWPHIAFLGEEMSRDEQIAQLANCEEDLWCLDPLDGTSNFAMGIPIFAVSLALVRRGQPVLGVVYDPMRDECFMAERGKGAWLNDQPLRLSAPHLPLANVIAGVDFKRLTPALRTRLANEPPYSSQRNFGSSALEWCWLASERFRVYVHGGQQLWDYAAGCLILEEAGGFAVTLQGESVFRMEAGPRSVVAAMDAELFAEWKDSLGVPDGSGRAVT